MDPNIISELKTKYSHIYSVSDEDGTEYLFRSLTLEEVRLVEYFIVNRLKTGIEIEDHCLETCILYPENLDLDEVAPGTAQQISEEILRISGIADANYVITSMLNTRAKMDSDILIDIKSYIISAMPSYNDNELDKFTLLELIEKLILSEKILTLQSQLAGVDQKIELNIERIDGEENIPEEEYEVVRKKTSKATNKTNSDLPSKEELIRRIQKENAEQYSSRDHYVNPNASEEWQGFDLELLDKMEGVKDIADDPIARKLHGLE